MEDIKTKIMRYYDFATDSEYTRYKSWEYCRSFFIEIKDKYNQAQSKEEKSELNDSACLQLAFYLASWGMYRGSSFLLQKDYKAHSSVIDIIFEKDYEDLWFFDPVEEIPITIDAAKKLLFDKDGLYWRIKKEYADMQKKMITDDDDSNGDNNGNATDTLVTKVLMGTFACVPAFDRFLKDGIGHLKQDYIKEKGMSQNIENGGDTFIALCNYLKKETGFRLAKEKLDKRGKGKNRVDYTYMKLMDMYLWEIGYEWDLLCGMYDDKKAEKMLNKAKQMGCCDQKDSLEDAKERVIEYNPWFEAKLKTKGLL